MRKSDYVFLKVLDGKSNRDAVRTLCTRYHWHIMYFRRILRRPHSTLTGVSNVVQTLCHRVTGVFSKFLIVNNALNVCFNCTILKHKP